ncbi:ferrous iron transport protein B [Frisingicoccus sp.]|uniref:ferrous iron transport protein B n=1 Tax=Frisingicoccus sp. TaxID=1918627 RepID=UPI0025B8C9E7|nr:ferrous iron transport protein B [Frisingicoccus sp.]
MNQQAINVAFAGNPNCGKTTLFNAYTGARLKVSNWPGVTVEKKEGAFKFHDNQYKLVDLPGLYSLTCYSTEEILSRQYLLGDEVDVVVDVADASNLERNLYLTLQLIELGKPVILALNMMDIVEERGMEIDMHRLPEMLGIPVVPVSARKRTGLEVLMHTVAHHQGKANSVPVEHHHDLVCQSVHRHNHHHEFAMVYSDEIEDKIDDIEERLLKKYPDIVNPRWHAIKMLEKDVDIMKKYPVYVGDIVDKNYEHEIINQKYDFIEEIIDEVVMNKASKEARTDKADELMTHPVWGMPIFFGIMAVVFLLTFVVGDWISGGFEVVIGIVTDFIQKSMIGLHLSDGIISLVCDGIITGVGGILTFLPNIFILFLALAFLEDSGYMARVAYVMDGLMGKMGLSGRAFIPMLLGFGCTVPAIMSARTLEDTRDRLRTIMVTPFMSCSARLPIYVLFSKMFFGKYAMIAAFSMYVIGLLVAIGVALIYSKVVCRNEEKNCLLIELPEYKAPNARTIIIYVWEKVADYLTKAGTTILAGSVILWVIMNFGPEGMVTDISQSFAAGIGCLLVPILAPAGLGLWQMGVALISGIAAKEMVVSSCSVLFGMNINSDAGIAAFQKTLEGMGFGMLNAYALMVFCLLYIPCMATIATIHKETESWKWTIAMILLQLLIAWGMAVIVFQAGSFFIGG